jgi:ABC-type Mn2+/Zn2+ transport system permease subunit
MVLRGSAFLGEAMSHGMLPGVAIASLLGGSLLIGALVAALAMAVGIAAVGRSAKLSADTSIGLLLVGMLALGVVIVSRSQSFAVDLTDFLFGDVLAIRPEDLLALAAALGVTTAAVLIGHRAFLAAAFDVRKAATLRLRPELALPALTVLVAVAMVASFHVVGTLLVLGLLIAPPATALAWVGSVPRIMLTAAVIGSVAVYLGLVVSWHAGTAGGATIAGVAVLMFVCSTLAASLRGRLRQAAMVSVSAALVAGCAAGGPPVDTSAGAGHDEVVVEGAQEVADPSTRLVLVDPSSGAASVFDAVDETETPTGTHGPVDALSGDGRFAYLHTARGAAIVDAGAWTFDHGDHYHYFVAEPGVAGTVEGTISAVAASNSIAALELTTGAVALLDRERLGQGAVESPTVSVDGVAAAAVPYGRRIIVVSKDGRIRAIGSDGSQDLAGECRDAAWGRATRKAVVFGCATGAVRITGGDKALAVTAIPFPPNSRVKWPFGMDHRDRADIFAGVADEGVWVLDSRQRSWTSIPLTGAVVATTAGDGTVLVLHRDGTLRSYDVLTARERAAIPLFPGSVPAADPQPVIEVDSDRAYVNNAGDREVYEIDYADGLRVARTLRTAVAPGLMVESGR